jgi:two-component system cell cycle sensor histidine kinase/response regulator CckA
MRVLLVEDNPGDARLVREMVRDVPDLSIHHVDRLAAGLEHLAARKVDVVLLDLGLPDSQGLETLRTFIRWGHAAVPVVVLTGLDDETIGRQAVREGAQDYLLKSLVSGPALTRVLCYAIERKQAGEKLQQSETQYRSLTENSPDLIARFDRECRHLYVNPAAARAGRHKPEEYVGRSLVEVGVPEREAGKWEERIRAAFETGRIVDVEDAFETPAGVRYFNTRFVPEVAPDGSIQSVQSIARDFTERKRAAEELSHLSARHEAILSEIPDIVMEVDANKVYIWANAAGLDFFGEDVIGREAAEYFFGEQETYMKVRPLFAGDTATFYVESWQRRRDGQKRLLGWWCRALTDADGCVIGALSTARDITEPRLAEDALAASEIRYRRLFESARDGILILDADTGIIVDANPFLIRLLGHSHEQFLGKRVWELGFFKDIASNWDKFLELQKAGYVRYEDLPLESVDGRQIEVEFVSNVYPVGKDNVIQCNIRDITERKRAEADAEKEREKLHGQLVQAQKMESIGRLAGGVAHDYNNMLSVILGYAELALREVDPSGPVHSDLVEIHKAARRSTDITRQLLAFARKQTIVPRALDLNETVEGMLNMLRRLIGEGVELVWLPGAGAWQVRMDPSQVDQILANLCINARDAIADVGRISIETGNTTLNEAYCSDHMECQPGEYVMLNVSDNGRGMDRDTLDKIFEPFFTTKEIGRGTGLGLSTAYGIVKQNNGAINVYSEPGVGTTFRIYLPRHKPKTGEIGRQSPAASALRGQETILLAEDEPAILKLTATMLECQGYTVLTASTPGEAARLATEHRGEIQLLMTDVVMPEMCGLDLSKKLMSIRPGIRLLFISGYTADVIAHHGVLEDGVHFIQKPYSMEDLAAKVREVLDGSGD